MTSDGKDAEVFGLEGMTGAALVMGADYVVS
jgi:hypothetical protein